MVKASNGKLSPALTVFALALKYFRDHALQELSDQCGMKIVNDDVRWVISVPAIWRASAKQFMRQAAYEVINNVFRSQLQKNDFTSLASVSYLREAGKPVYTFLYIPFELVFVYLNICYAYNVNNITIGVRVLKLKIRKFKTVLN